MTERKRKKTALKKEGAEKKKKTESNKTKKQNKVEFPKQKTNKNTW